MAVQYVFNPFTGNFDLINSSSASGFTTTSKTANYTMSTGESVLCDASGGSFTITVPNASGNTNTLLQITRTDQTLANSVTISGTGMTSNKLMTQGESATYISDGTNWIQTDRRIPSVTTAYTPTFSSGFGTVTGISVFWKRTGDLLFVQGLCDLGTVSTGLGSISLPSGLSIDTAKIVNATTSQNSAIIGHMAAPVANQIFPALASVTTSATVIYMGRQYANNNMIVPADDVNSYVSGTQGFTFYFSVPIANWAG